MDIHCLHWILRLLWTTLWMKIVSLDLRMILIGVNEPFSCTPIKKIFQLKTYVTKKLNRSVRLFTPWERLLQLCMLKLAEWII